MLAPEFLPIWGGTGSYVVELVKFLPRNVNVHVITLKRDIPGMSTNLSDSSRVVSMIDRQLEIHYLSASRETFFYNLPFQIACLRRVPSLAKEFRFDIFHSHLVHMPDIFLQLFNRVHVPTVATIHGTIQLLRKEALLAGQLFGDLERSEKSALMFYPIIRLLQRDYVKHISRLIAVSHFTKDIAIDDLNVEKTRISVVHNGVDTDLFSPPNKDELEKRYSAPTVVYIGRMIAKKGIYSLIRAMPEVLRAFPKTRFLFVGGGNISQYQQIIKDMGISTRNFSFSGHLGYFERPKILREATVFVNPSLCENCSISILEAMSCSATVIASDVGGNPEIIESGRNGVLVSRADSKMLASSIISLLENESFNMKIGKEARRTVEKSFSSKNCAEQTFNIYQQVLDNKDLN
jgi:glycosyltransferase involved in cell wall biosynthesis